MAARKAFSIVESTLAVLVVGGALVAAANVATTAHRAHGAATNRRMAERLAHTLMAEVLMQPAAGADATSATAGPRLNNFDHVQDYDAFRESPPTSAQGLALAPAGWAWRVSIASRGPEMIDDDMLNLRMRQITVGVELPDGTEVSISALRGDWMALQRTPVDDVERTVAMPITIKLIDGSALHAAPAVRGQRVPDSARQNSGVR